MKQEIIISKPYSDHPDDWYLAVVLCKTTNQLTPFVTWIYNNREHGFYEGHYFETKEDAMMDFKLRPNGVRENIRKSKITITAESPERGEIIELGTYMWAQLTYTDLRAGNDNDEKYNIAWIDEDGDWYINHQYAREHGIINEGPYSDIIIG